MSTSAHWPGTIREINDLPDARKRAIYQVLIPHWVYPMFGIDPQHNTLDGQEVITIRCPAGSSSVEISVFHQPGADEPALYLHMGDSFHSQLVVLLVVVNDPSSPRFDIDVDEQGRPTKLGTAGRNIPEELRAMRAGLAPGQVRRGLRIFRSALPAFEQFVGAMGHALFFIEPLFYHNAITFERYGFSYARGLQKMKRIHAEFSPGGRLAAALDGSTPFRHPDVWNSVRGRSWAIHDGVLGESFTDVQMYRRIGVDAGVMTFPGGHW